MDPEIRKQIKKVFWPVHTPLREDEVEITVSSMAKLYPEGFQVFIPKHPYKKIPNGYELQDSSNRIYSSYSERSDEEEDIYKEENIDRSIRRTKTTIRDYIMCNYFDLFVTFTFGKSHGKDEQNIQQMHDWIKNQQKRIGPFDYLLVMERHKKDNAIHFHGVFKNYIGKIEPSFSAKTGRPIIKRGKQVYQIPGFTLGFTNVQFLDKEPESYSKASRYLTKYITKDMPTFANQNRYWASKGLLTPPKVDNVPLEYMLNTPVWQQPTVNGLVLFFPYPEQHDDWQDAQGLIDILKAQSEAPDSMEMLESTEGSEEV